MVDSLKTLRTTSKSPLTTNQLEKEGGLEPRKFYTGIDVSDRSDADIVSLFHISETNSYS